MLTPYPIILSSSNSEGRWWSNNTACYVWTFAQNISELLAFKSLNLCSTSLCSSHLQKAEYVSTHPQFGTIIAVCPGCWTRPLHYRGFSQRHSLQDPKKCWGTWTTQAFCDLQKGSSHFGTFWFPKHLTRLDLWNYANPTKEQNKSRRYLEINGVISSRHSPGCGSHVLTCGNTWITTTV